MTISLERTTSLGSLFPQTGTNIFTQRARIQSRQSSHYTMTQLTGMRQERNTITKQNDRALYKSADTACKNFIMEVVDETWYKYLEEPDTFDTNITDLKLLDVDIPQLTKMLFTDVNGIPKFINAMEAAQ